MKTIRKIIGGLIVVLALTLSALPARAIEGLNLSVQCSNVVLSWPSIEWKNYIVQYRPTLDTNTPWQTLTSSLPADLGTNMTFFVHSNAVQNPNCGGGSFAMSDGGNESSPAKEFSLFDLGVPLATRADGTGSVVPLALYPPGFNLSSFLIFDPATSEWFKGSASLTKELYSAGFDDPQPQDGDGPEDAGSPPETGFYQVVQDGVAIANSSLTNLTNGVLSGTVNISFEAGNADGTGADVIGSLSSATLIIDGEKYPAGASLNAKNRPWNYALDTAYLENGDHYLQIQVSWKNPDNTDRHQYFSRYSDPFLISVSNQIYYPDWLEDVGEMPVSAYFLKTTCTDADWQIDIYDANTNFLKSLTGHTMDGIIEAYWDMLDTNGVAHTNADVDPEFISIATVADPVVKKLPPKKQKPNTWPDHGKWVIAYQDYFKFEYSQNNAQQGSINAFANTSAKYGGYYLYYPQPGQTNDLGQTYPLRYQKDNHYDTNLNQITEFLDEQMLRQFLTRTNSRNFYYDGHGDVDNIVSSSLDVAMLKATIQHRYRFVFLNGCSTANGDLDKAFGINGPKRFDIDYYHKTGIRPGAFLGYDVEVNYAEGGPVEHGGVRYDDTIPWQVPGFITNLLFYWDTDLIGYGILSAIDHAKSGLPPVEGQYREDHLKIHGYFNLHIDEVNHRYDTW